MSKRELSEWRVAIWWAKGQDFFERKALRPHFQAFFSLWYGALMDEGK